MFFRLQVLTVIFAANAIARSFHADGVKKGIRV